MTAIQNKNKFIFINLTLYIVKSYDKFSILWKDSLVAKILKNSTIGKIVIYLYMEKQTFMKKLDAKAEFKRKVWSKLYEIVELLDDTITSKEVDKYIDAQNIITQITFDIANRKF